MKTIVIIGGVAGGASAAARLRRLDEESKIILLEKGNYISFANCGLPYYIGGTIPRRSSLLLQTPESFYNRFKVDVRINHEALSIDSEKKEVKVLEHKTGNVYVLPYDQLIASPGSTPLKPPIPGIDGPHIFTLWNIDDTDEIHDFIENQQPKTAVVIGGGFIGLEMVENLVDRGIETHLVEMLPQVMAPLDMEMAQIVHRTLENKGVHMHLRKKVEKFEQDLTKTLVYTGEEEFISTDMVIVSMGVRPQTDFLKDTVEIGPRGHVVTDKNLYTGVEGIYAVGDAVEVTNFITGDQTAIPLAGPANKQGRMAADNIVRDNPFSYKGSQGTAIAKVFNLDVASCGLNEKNLKQMGKVYDKDYLITQIISNNHAGYYPQASAMMIKVIFEKDTGKLLGAQIVGSGGVDKRIDVFATVQRLGGTVKDLKELELAYAPPYSSAKDPMNMVGFVSENILEGLVTPVHIHQLADYPNAQFLDVRTPQECNVGKIKNSINIPVDELRNRLDELDKDQEIIVYCAIGVRGYIASKILRQHGFTNVKNLAGGFTAYAFCHPSDDEFVSFLASVSDDKVIVNK